MSKSIDISIIIPTKNEELHIGQLLHDISKQKLVKKNGRKLKVEVIVADGGSTDKTKKIAKLYDVKIIKGGHPSVGRNAGAKKAKGKVLYFMDADIRIDPLFINESYQEFIEKKLDIAAIDNLPKWEGKENYIQRTVLEFFYMIGNVIIRILQKTKTPKLISTCMIVKKKSFDAVGGFNENIYVHGDAEVTERVANAGFEMGVLDRDRIWASTRKPLKHGVVRYYISAALINHHRMTKGEVYTPEVYQQITGEKDYFTKK